MKYDESFEPPAPIAKIAARNVKTGERARDISVLLDTGSDVSLLPKSVLGSLGISPLPNESYRLEGFNGSQTSAEVFYLQVVFLGNRFTGKYCVNDDDIGILGRDVLNEFAILFDGKNLEWKAQE